MSGGDRRGRFILLHRLLRYWKGPAVGLASTLLTLAVTDRVLSRFYPPFAVRLPTLVADPDLGWKLSPNNLVPDWEFWTNSLGFRGGEFRREGKRPLVAFLGDSVTHGAVRHRETFPAQFEEATGWRAFNLGVPMYGPREYLKALRLVQRFEPDVVVAALFVGNDVSDCQDGRATDFLRAPEHLPDLPRWQWSGIYRFLLSRGVIRGSGLARALAGAADPEWERTENRSLTRQEFTAMELARVQVFRRRSYPDRWECLRRTLREVAALRPDTVLLVLPDELQVNDGLWEEIMKRAGDPGEFERRLPNRMIGALGAEIGLRVVDATDALRTAGRPTFIPEDGHPNSEGNRVIASLLVGELQTFAGR